MAASDGAYRVDALDLALLTALRAHPRSGDLQLSRLVEVARATVQSRLRRLEAAGIITGWGPDVDVSAAGFDVQAFISLEIAQGALDRVRDELLAIPHVVEAYATTGTSDLLCRVSASSHAELQEVVLRLNRSATVVRSTSVVVLSVVIAPRVLPLLETSASERRPQAPAYR